MSGAVPVVNDLDFQSDAKAINLPNPTAGGDAVNKSYADGLIKGMSWKDNVRAASTGNVSLAAAPASFDSVVMAVNDRVLLKDQTDPKENGIYVFGGTGNALVRTFDAEDFDSLENAIVPVDEGVVNAGTQYRQTAVNGALGVNDVLWNVFQTAAPSATETTEGVSEIATQAEVDSGVDDVRFVTPKKLKDWAHGAKYHEETIGDGVTTDFTIVHGLDTQVLHCSVFQAAGNKAEVMVYKRIVDNNNVQVCFSTAPLASAYRVVILAIKP